MIDVKVTRDEAHEIVEITLTGHAGAGKLGEDIVCAAVSAVSFGNLNAVHLLLGTVPDVQTLPQEGGFLRWSLHPLEDASLHEKQQLLAESMIIALVAIAQQYGKYIRVSDNKW
ncbi:ribosomal-processing cysteine protease Prp [Brevibacillus dissolubilis]|uniref:ribosomal-processing cysteine protease Prp n=1 Tax=Brevibacillus dissolubilis TaxID=1844116 RepID=UPI0011173670|nr:ribosomal-processing cysteine protease Prp [Brevibacillus dissolubilis]